MTSPAQPPAPVMVSIIVPAFNAADTVADTLASVQAQTSLDWEVVVVDDGSTDGTAAVVEGLIPAMPGLRLVRQPNAGVSAARNAGIAVARHGWLLFLDADDLIAPTHLADLAAALQANPDLDIVYSGWARLAPDGSLSDERCWDVGGDLFPVFARLAAFPIHACIARRALVEAVGAFDPALRTCEDWDLWQRMARAGARFGAIHAVGALYRMRPASASIDARQMLLDGLRVLRQGHGPDPRVPAALSRHVNGLSPAELPRRNLHFASWSAALTIGSGGDARPLLDLLPDGPPPGADPYVVAESLFKGAILPGCHHPRAWPALWPAVAEPIALFLAALEARSGTAALAQRVGRFLERMIVDAATAERPFQLGATYAVQLEVTAPLVDLAAPAGADRLDCAVTAEGAPLGRLLLPICDGVVPAAVLADAVAAEFAWPLLGRFFARTLYPTLRAVADEGGLALWRDGVLLAAGLPAAADGDRLLAHDQIGWTALLQEVWGRPDLGAGPFYDPDAPLPGAPRRPAPDGTATVEATGELPELALEGETAAVALTVGGALVGVVPVPAAGGLVGAAALRAALTTAAGMELCRVAVREALLGRPFAAEPASLAARLAEAARGHGARPSLVAPAGRTMLLLRRASQPIGTSASRVAVLPAACAAELAADERTQVAGDGALGRVAYDPASLPELVLPSLPQTAGAAPPAGEERQASAYDRTYFESLFARAADPWRYSGPYEQTKYEQTLAMLPAGRIRDALEIACAEGHFTGQLAPRVERLLATDISRIALDRAAERCAKHTNIRYAQLDLVKDEMPGQFDLIVCSEVLYYVGDRAALAAVAAKIGAALRPGGHLVMAHANQLIDDPEAPGFDWELHFGARGIGETFAAVKGLRLVRELQTPAYRVQLFERERGGLLGWRRRPPQIEAIEQPTALPPSVAWQFSWSGGQPQRRAADPVRTDRLPILMYHQVAAGGAAALARYRVTPAAFEEQLRYLRDGGFTSVSLEQWQAAAAMRRPLPGRAVLITFDDGYRDFATAAWPLLKKYGFGATVFLVAGRVGMTNDWDRAFTEPVPLLTWDEIRALRDEGVSFGAHTFSHPPLTALSAAEVVSEGVRARATIAAQLGGPVSAIAYPYGDVDPAVQHLMGACGYVFGLTVRPGRSGFNDSPLALPRIEVMGDGNLQQFIASLA